jgi:TPR repeat protein
MKAASRPRRALAIAALGVTAALLAAANPAPGEPSALPLRLAQTSGADTLQIAVASSISAQSASQVALQIRLAPANALPKNSFVRVRGLPPAVSLSGGYATAPGAWAVPLYALASLQMIVPAGVAGRAELSISLVGEDGTLLADAKSVLVVEQSVQAAPRESKADVLPPARPQGPMLSPADRETAERLVARGERELEQGQVAVARQFLLRAAQAGLARGALLLAATYDPRELARWRVQGVQPNLDEARKWYERARELGAPEAEERLARLGAG